METYGQDAAFFPVRCFDGGDEVTPARNPVRADRYGPALDAFGHPAQEGSDTVETLNSLVLHDPPPRCSTV